MSREELFVKLNEIFRDVFDDDEILVGEATSSDDVEGWNSLMQINLIGVIEDELDIKFSVEEAVNVKTVGELADIIMEQMK